MVVGKHTFSGIRQIILLIFLTLLLSSLTLAHAEEEGSERSFLAKQQTIFIIIPVFIIVLVFVITALMMDARQSETTKRVLFAMISLPILIATAYIAYTTVSLNLAAESKGPVHWHADFEIWNCGEKIDLKDPKQWSNRIGNPVFHEHGDDRIHVEGVILNKEDITLHHFLQVLGGSLTENSFIFPTDEGSLTVHNGDICNGQSGKIQVFVYQTKEESYAQQKLDSFSEYVLSPYSAVPPGDCIIIEFDGEKERTDHLCASYQSAVERGELHGR